MKLTKPLALAFALLAGFAAVGATTSSALVVAIDRYPFAPKGPPDQVLCGARNDATKMSLVTHKLWGFETTVKLQQQATKEVIASWLGSTESTAKAGDRYCLYFSGLGSLVPGANAAASPQPTILPFDAGQTEGSNDLPLTRLAKWSEDLRSKGAFPIIVLDTCFYRLPNSKDFQAIPWKNCERCLTRQPVDPSQLTGHVDVGPAALLCACDLGGGAYEVRPTTDQDSWTGAFTEHLYEEAEYLSLTDSPDTPMELLLRARMRLQPLVTPNYLTEEIPLTPSVPLPPAYDLQLRNPEGTGIDTSPYNPLTDKYRVAISLPTQAPPTDAFRAAAGSLDKALTKVDPNITICQRGELPDRVIDLISTGPLTVQLDRASVGSAEQNDIKTFQAIDADGIIAEGLADRLEEARLAKQLFLLLDRPGREGPLGANFAASSDPTHYILGSNVKIPITLKLDPPSSGHWIALQRDDSNASVGLWLPNVYYTDTTIQPNSVFNKYTIKKGESEGHTLLYALFFPDAVQLPILPTRALGSHDPALPDKSLAFDRAAIALLKRAISIVSSNREPWACKRIDWDFRN